MLRTQTYYNLVPSCFGNKLETLIRLPGPIRTLKSPEELLPENHSLSAPGEVMRLVNWLMSNNEQPKGLFVQLPDEGMVAAIREVCMIHDHLSSIRVKDTHSSCFQCLDTGDEFPWPLKEVENDARVSHAFAHALLRLLDSLIEPIIPPILHGRCIQMTSRDDAFEVRGVSLFYL